MPDKLQALTPDALLMIDAIARNGSFAGAARELGRVPSALTYSVRQLEDALDVLLFDRSSGQARMTAAGLELLSEGRRLLAEMQGVANRVRRVATGWEAELTIAVDGVISRSTVFDLVQEFLEPAPPQEAPPTRLRLRTEVLAGTLDALLSGRADLSIGVPLSGVAPPAGFEVEALGVIDFVFVVSPHHALATAEEPLHDEVLVRHRAVAVADSSARLSPLTVNLLPGQDVLTVASTEIKLDAIIRGLGCGFLPEPMVRLAVAEGRLLVKAVRRPVEPAAMGYAWRRAAAGDAAQGMALSWWLKRLQQAKTRQALVERLA